MLPRLKLLHFINRRTLLFVFVLLVVVSVILGVYVLNVQSKLNTSILSESQTKTNLAKISQELENLKNTDQVKRNDALQEEINNIQKTYKKALEVYEKLLKLQEQTNKTADLEKFFAKSLSQLSDRNYSSASANLTKLASDIDAQTQKVATEFTIPKNVPVNNAPPAGGYSRQQVQAEIGSYLVDIVSADMGGARAIVDTASDGDCHDNCPVLSLGEYVARNGAFAGINGSYFCPASYPSCAGKANSFDTLLMNKNKVYFNSDNNVYSTLPAAIFLSGSIRFVGQSLEWGRDTGVDGVIANQPLLLSGGNIVFGGSGDPKQGSKGSRSFVGSRGSTIYIGVVHNATVAEVAYVLKALGLEGALNLDSGGSTALWHGGYKVGPGRNIPNAVLLVGK